MKRSLCLLPLALALVAACAVETSPTEQPADRPTGACPAPTGAPLEHAGDVKGAEVWKADVIHLVTAHVNVRDGARLTIEPCAVVRVAEGANVNVAYPLEPNAGELVALGTADKPIKIEPLDGARWGHVRVAYPGKAYLAHVTIEGGGGGDEAVAGESLLITGDARLPSKHHLSVDHVTIKGSLGAGARLEDSAAFDPASRDLVLTGNGNDAHPYPIEITQYALGTLPTGAYTGNRRDEINIDPQTVDGVGGLQEDATLRDLGVPYHVGDAQGPDHLVIGQGKEGVKQPVVTIEPGVKIRFEKGARLEVAGTETDAAALRAIGTAEKPVIFTSASASPAPGDWQGLYFNGGPSADNRLERVRLEYTGASCGCTGFGVCDAGVTTFDAAIIVDGRAPAEPFLKDSVIAYASGHGVLQGWWGVDLDWKTSNTFEGVAQCPQTTPPDATSACPDPRPACK